MTIDPNTNRDHLREWITYLYAAIARLCSGLFSLIAYRGQPGHVYFNVDHIDHAHGMLEVRRSAASGNQAKVYFRVDNRRALDRSRVSGRTIQKILSAALLEGLQPIRVVLEGERVRYYDRAFEIARQDVRERDFGHAFFPQRIVSPAEAGLVLDPTNIVFRSP
jgi:hypothetical protein